MEHYFNEDALCLVVNLQEEDNKDRYYSLLDEYKVLTQESYEEDKFWIYVNCEGDYELINELEEKLDELEIELEEEEEY